MLQVLTTQERETIYQKIDNLDISHVVSATGVNLERSSNKIRGLCPLHIDKDSPSFTIYPQTNSWTCFGGCSGKKGKRNGGGVFSYLKQFFGESRAAIEWVQATYPDLKTPTTEPILVKKREEDVIYPGDVQYWADFLWLDQQQDFFLKRGFTEETINNEGFGWDGSSFIIPLWEGKPFSSPCYAVKKRTTEVGLPKYIKYGQYSKSLIYGKYNNFSKVAFLFAGELDAALARQNGLPALSVVDGMGAGLPADWPNLYFSNQDHLIFSFDRKEAKAAGILASRFEAVRGLGTSSVISMPPFEGDDYTDYVKEFSHEMYMKIISIYKPDIDQLLQGDF